MPLPSTKQFRDLLQAQLRREVALAPTDPLPPSAPWLSFAVYVDAHLGTRAVLEDWPACSTPPTGPVAEGTRLYNALLPGESPPGTSSRWLPPRGSDST